MDPGRLVSTCSNDGRAAGGKTNFCGVTITIRKFARQDLEVCTGHQAAIRALFPTPRSADACLPMAPASLDKRGPVPDSAVHGVMVTSIDDRLFTTSPDQLQNHCLMRNLVKMELQFSLLRPESRNRHIEKIPGRDYTARSQPRPAMSASARDAAYRCLSGGSWVKNYVIMKHRPLAYEIWAYCSRYPHGRNVHELPHRFSK